MAIRCPLIVVSYGVNASVTLRPMPMIGNLVRVRMARACWRPAGPQSSPWLLASVTKVTPACSKAVTAVGGAKNTYVLGCGVGHPPSVSDDSKLTILTVAPARSAGTVGPRAVAGSPSRRSPRLDVDGKLTSPPKAKVTARPSPVQSGSRRDPGDFAGLAPRPAGGSGCPDPGGLAPAFTTKRTPRTSASRTRAASQRRRLRRTRGDVAPGGRRGPPQRGPSGAVDSGSPSRSSRAGGTAGACTVGVRRSTGTLAGKTTDWSSSLHPPVAGGSPIGAAAGSPGWGPMVRRRNSRTVTENSLRVHRLDAGRSRGSRKMGLQ